MLPAGVWVHVSFRDYLLGFAIELRWSDVVHSRTNPPVHDREADLLVPVLRKVRDLLSARGAHLIAPEG